MFTWQRKRGQYQILVTPLKGAVLFSYFLFHSQKETCINKNEEQDSYVVVAKEEVNERGGVVIN